MVDNEKRVRDAENFAGLRRGLLVVNAMAYVVAIVATGLSHTRSYGVDPQTLSGAQMTAWPVWFLSLLGILWTIRRASQRPDIGALVNDERTAGMGAKAFQAGYWLLLLAIAAAFAATWFTPIDIRLVLPVMLALGVAAPPLTFAFLYRS